jgi:hypothetical protein
MARVVLLTTSCSLACSISRQHREAEGLSLEPFQSHSFCNNGTISRQVVMHHKTGTMMSLRAMLNLNVRAKVVCTAFGESWTAIPVDTSGLGVPEDLAVNNVWLNKRNQHVLHVARNPFETVASELPYDLGRNEPWWMLAPMNNDADRCCFHRCSKSCYSDDDVPDKSLHRPRFCLGIRAVNDAVAAGGHLHGVLPQPVPADQPWSDYLATLEEWQGLLAVAVAMQNITLEPMNTTRHTLLGAGMPAYTMVCESKFDDAAYEDCEALWVDLLQNALAVPAEASAFLGEAAATECPNAPGDPAADHSSYAGQAEAADRVALLRQLDRQYLNGTIAAYERAVPCEISARYTAPSAAT